MRLLCTPHISTLLCALAMCPDVYNVLYIQSSLVLCFISISESKSDPFVQIALKSKQGDSYIYGMFNLDKERENLEQESRTGTSGT